MSASKVRNRMAPGVPQVREIANTLDKLLLTPNERILNEVFKLYTEKDVGFVELGKRIGEEVRAPRKKITVLLLGNHSAGKSSFINWYIEETILKTGVAIETQGYVFVVSGKKRDSLKGKATLELYPHLQPLKEYPGVLDFLATEISPSRSRKFNLVTFIDTPGLVDGDMHYPFDVNETLLWLGDTADLVFVFFDPMGQALCKRTLNVVEAMFARNSEKMKFFLAKSDTAGTETDRQKVLMQIVQELCKRDGLNRTGFEMPTIYLPDAGKPTKCANQIEEVCELIEKTIEQVIQNSLNNLGSDAIRFKEKLSGIVEADKEARARNFTSRSRSLFYGMIGSVLPIIVFMSLVMDGSNPEAMRRHVGPGGDYIYAALKPLGSVWNLVPKGYEVHVVSVLVLISGIFLIVSRLFCATEKVLGKEDLKLFTRGLRFANDAEEKKKTLYDEYLRESLSEQDY